MADPTSRPRLLVWWEDLRIGVQVLVVLPIALVAMFVIHLWAFQLTAGRSVTYAGFWGLVVTFVVVGSTRLEGARRRAAEERDRRP